MFVIWNKLRSVSRKWSVSVLSKIDDFIAWLIYIIQLKILSSAPDDKYKEYLAT